MPTILTGWTRGGSPPTSMQVVGHAGGMTRGDDPVAATRAGLALAYGTTGGVSPGVYNPTVFAAAPDASDQPVTTGVPAVATAVDHNTSVLTAPTDGQVTGVSYTPASTITGAATNSRTVSLVNVSNGNAVVATLAFVAGVNAPGGVAKVIPLSGTPANLVLEEGDVLEWHSTHIGTGLADPGGVIEIDVNPI